jgi:serine/threonine-protein kinase
MAGDLWVYDLQRRISTQVTKGVPATGPLWTPDGRFLVFSTFDNIAWVASDGGAEPKPLLPPAPSAVRYPTSIRRIGDHLVLGIMQLQVGSPQAWDLWTVELANEGAELRTTAPRPYLKTRYDERQLALSPDGRWVAYNSNESGSQQEVYVRAFPDDGRRWKISDGGGMVPQWAPERPLLVFQGASRQLMAAAYSTTNGTFVPGAPKVWSSEPVLERQVRVYSIRRSDTRVAALLRDPAVEQQSDHVVALWTDILEELERRSAGRR